MSSFKWLVGVLWLLLIDVSNGEIRRGPILEYFHPRRSNLRYNTPLQVGNGNFAFNADITGLQTLQPFNTLSGWGWHSSPRLGQSRKVKRNEDVLTDVRDCAYMHRGRL